MRKILCFFLALTMLIPLTACRKNTAADENILQNLYTQVTDEPLVKSMDAIPSNVVFADGKYYVFSREDNREAYLYDKTADAYEEEEEVSEVTASSNITEFPVSSENNSIPAVTPTEGKEKDETEEAVDEIDSLSLDNDTVSIDTFDFGSSEQL